MATYSIYGHSDDPMLIEFLKEQKVEFREEGLHIEVELKYQTDFFLLGKLYAQWKIRKALGI